MIVGGFAAPSFLFLAGMALALAAVLAYVAAEHPRRSRACPPSRAPDLRLRVSFRLQSWVISGGDPAQALLKVDILNIMGLSMLAAAVLWSVGRSRLDGSRGWSSLQPWSR
jgi:hypothetical protein